jgi:tRNA1(Val) A37 N6-methylase TrmN6
MVWTHVPHQKRHTQDGCQLAGLMRPAKKNVRAIDVGCGDGIIAFELIRLGRANKVFAFDVSKFAIEAAQENLKELILKNEVELACSSASTIFKKKKFWDSFNLFVINPPFFPPNSGQKSKKGHDQLARHEGSLTLELWAKGAGRLLRIGGELFCVFPTERLAECFSLLRKNRVEPKELWWFKNDKRKRRFFLRAVRGGRPGLRVHFEAELKGVTQGQNG